MSACLLCGQDRPVLRWETPLTLPRFRFACEPCASWMAEKGLAVLRASDGASPSPIRATRSSRARIAASLKAMGASARSAARLGARL